jgi:hypothetical protein
MGEEEEEDKCWICGRTAEDVAQALTKMGCSQKLLEDIRKMAVSKEVAVTEDGLIMCVPTVYHYNFPICAICWGIFDWLAYRNGCEAAKAESIKIKEEIINRARIAFRPEAYNAEEVVAELEQP